MNQSPIELELTSFPLTDIQKNEMYNKDISRLKAQVLEFMLIDPIIAAKFMNELNSIINTIENDGELSVDVFKRLLDFEEKLNTEMSNLHQENSSIAIAVEHKCKTILDELSPDTIQSAEEAWRQLKDQDFSCTLNERSQIENLLSNLHFHIIKEKLKTSSISDLRGEISESEVSEMKSCLYYKLSSLLSSQNESQRVIAKAIQSYMLFYSSTQSADKANEMVYDINIWKQFIEAYGEQIIAPQPDIINSQQIVESQPHTTNSNPTTETALALLAKPNLFKRIATFFKGLIAPKVPEDPKELIKHKKPIEQITDISVSDDVLYNAVISAVKDNSSPLLVDEYSKIADKKLPVYQFFKQLYEATAIRKISFTYMKNGINYTCKFSQSDDKHDKHNVYIITLGSSEENTITKKYTAYYPSPIATLKFADFLYGQEKNKPKLEQIKQEIGNSILAKPSTFIYNDDLGKNYSNLHTLVASALEEYETSYVDFFAEEEQKIAFIRKKIKSAEDKAKIYGKVNRIGSPTLPSSRDKVKAFKGSIECSPISPVDLGIDQPSHTSDNIKDPSQR